MYKKKGEAEQERRRRRKKNRLKVVLIPSTMSRACGVVTWDEKQGGNRDESSPQAGERERFTCTFYLDVCQTRQLQSDHEREKERQ